MSKRVKTFFFGSYCSRPERRKRRLGWPLSGRPCRPEVHRRRAATGSHRASLPGPSASSLRSGVGRAPKSLPGRQRYSPGGNGNPVADGNGDGDDVSNFGSSGTNDRHSASVSQRKSRFGSAGAQFPPPRSIFGGAKQLALGVPIQDSLKDPDDQPPGGGSGSRLGSVGSRFSASTSCGFRSASGSLSKAASPSATLFAKIFPPAVQTTNSGPTSFFTNSSSDSRPQASRWL